MVDEEEILHGGTTGRCDSQLCWLGWTRDGQRWALVVYVVRARLGARKARRGRSTPCATSPCSVMCHRASKITPTEVVDERLCPTRSRSPQQPARRAQQQPAQSSRPPLAGPSGNAPTHLTPTDGGGRAVKSLARFRPTSKDKVLRCRTQMFSRERLVSFFAFRGQGRTSGIEAETTTFSH